MLPIKPSNHRRRTQRAVSIAIGAWLLTAPAWAQDASSATGLRRGIGIADALGWAPVEPAPSRAFVYPPFEEFDAVSGKRAEGAATRRASISSVWRSTPARSCSFRVRDAITWMTC